MSSTYHTPIVNGDERKNDAAIWNDPLGELDAQIAVSIAAVATEAAARASAVATEAAARVAGDTVLDDRIDDLIIDSGTSDAETIAARTAINYKVGSPPATLGAALGYAAGKVYNIEAYGATTAGSAASNTTAINAAIDAASTAGGGIVLVPNGTYEVNALFPQSGVMLAGTNKFSSVLKRPNSGSAIMVTAFAESNFAISNITLDGNRANCTGDLPHTDIRDSYNFSFDNVRFINALQYGLWLDGCYTAGDDYHIRITNCDFDNFEDYGIYLGRTNATSTVATSWVMIRGCSFRDSHPVGGGAGIGIIKGSASTRGSHFVISDCQFTNMDDSAVIVIEADDITISGCEGDTVGACIWFQSSSFANYCKNVGVHNCVFTSSGDEGLELSYCWHFNVTGNTFYNCGHEGITIRSCIYGVVMGNVCYNNGQNGSRQIGICLTDFGTEAESTRYVIVQGNQCNDTQGSPTQTTGIGSSSYDNYNIIRDNWARANSTVHISYFTGRQAYNWYEGNRSDFAVGSVQSNGRRYYESSTSANQVYAVNFKIYEAYEIKMFHDISIGSIVGGIHGKLYPIAITNTGANTLTAWPANTRFVGGSAPSSISGTVTVLFYYDGDANVFREVTRSTTTT